MPWLIKVAGQEASTPENDQRSVAPQAATRPAAHNYLLPETAEQETLLRLQELRRDGLGYLKIANVLTEEGMATKKGGQWQSMSVRSVILSAEKMKAA